ncbi:MAG TPA: TIM44-like domain-containing protein, partial [Thermoanaerobaculia bacterium]|nr:TIM44-like domain-containing protein [Thermoanaerobaculia bacterium]
GGGSSSSGGGSSGSSSGGGSYSGGSSSGSSSYDSSPSSGSSSSSSSGGDASCSVILFILLVLIVVVAQIMIRERQSDSVGGDFSSAPLPASRMLRPGLSQLQRFDPNFSEIVFTDFCYSLFARVHEARGSGRLDDYAPYVAQSVRDLLKKRNAAGLTSVDEIVIGSFKIAAVRGLERPHVEVDIEIDANYTETIAGTMHRWYVIERWGLTRLRDILSPAPENARADHCPKCGAALQTRTDGACLHCGTVIAGDNFQWFVRGIFTEKKDERPHELGGGSGDESGRNMPTIYQPGLEQKRQELTAADPKFTWAAFSDRVRHVAQELQAAWSSRDWNRARPYETDALFQMHRYWIDEYTRQRLRNIVDDFKITDIPLVKVTRDAFYDAITVRMYASGADYTVDDTGAIVGGSKFTRHWSEYWTFIRSRAAASAAARICPNCGGPRDEGQTAICNFCGGKIVAGEFPWVLSRIEQDESYS